MSTIAKVETETRLETASATDVRNVAAAICQAIIALHEFYAKNFPYDIGKLIKDIGLLLLFEMTDRIVVECYEMINGQKIERLSYTYRPKSVPGAVNSQPGDFPRHHILPSWQMRLVSYYPTTKPVSEVKKFYDQLGWLPTDFLTRTGQGTTEQYGMVVSGGYSVAKEVYTDLPNKLQTIQKELAIHEIN